MDFTKMKTLTFEGAGWNMADSCGDVGNCRIRATFLNKNGREIYIELNSIVPHKRSMESQKSFKIAGWVSHLFYTADHKMNHSVGLSCTEGMNFEWNKASILKLVNSYEIGGDFEAIEVLDDWNGFALNGKPNEGLG